MTELSDDILREWLLHRLPAQEAQALEERLLHDDDFGEHLRAVEIDLLDDFARGRLTDADRDAVASYLVATPGDRARLRVAMALASIGDELARTPRATPARAVRHASAPPSARRPQRRRRAVAGGLIASACVIVLAAIGLDRRAGIEMLVPGSVQTTATIILLADQQRGVVVEKIRIPRHAAKIRLQAEVGSAAPQARYTLSIVDGARTLFSARDLVPREASPYTFVEVICAAQMLSDGAQQVRVAAQGTPAGEAVWSIQVRAE